jgi:DNA polymerase (family X)
LKSKTASVVNTEMPKPKPQLDKFAIAATLQEIAALMELKGGVYKFKARAYSAGARAIAGVSGELGDLVKQERLTSLPGIGNALASQIKQLYLTGESSVLTSLRQEFPPGIIELSGVQGLSVGKIKQLHEGLGVTSVSELKAAAEAGKIRNLKGFGAKTESKLLETVVEHTKRGKKQKRLHLHRALRTAEQVQNYLKTARGLKQLSVAGSLRRWNETVGTIKFVASTNQPTALVQHFLRFPYIVQTESQSDDRASVVFADGSRVSLFAVNPDDFAATLFAETGSKEHVAKVARLFNQTKPRKPRKTRPGKVESKLNGDTVIYQQLGMQYIPPELREDTGEI